LWLISSPGSPVTSERETSLSASLFNFQVYFPWENLEVFSMWMNGWHFRTVLWSFNCVCALPWWLKAVWLPYDICMLETNCRHLDFVILSILFQTKASLVLVICILIRR
jgi:hypothetical protein